MDGYNSIGMFLDFRRIYHAKYDISFFLSFIIITYLENGALDT